MKTVDVIRPGSLRTIIGPSGTLKRIIQNKDYFEHRGLLRDLSECIRRGAE